MRRFGGLKPTPWSLFAVLDSVRYHAKGEGFSVCHGLAPRGRRSHLRNRDGCHSRKAAVCLRSPMQGLSGTTPERIEPIEMSDNVWYYVASQTEDKETATLWMVLRDESGYTCRTWQLAGFDRRKVDAWMRMTEQRRSKGLAIDPPPDIRDMTPEEAHFTKIHEARAYLGTPWDPTLRRHAAEFFRQIDPVKYPG